MSHARKNCHEIAPRGVFWRGLLATAILGLSVASAENAAPTQTPHPRGKWGRPSPLPLPSLIGTERYEGLLFPFLNERKYLDLGWTPDKGVRDTGPYKKGVSYGVHPAVRIYYSPEIIAWLVDDKRGAIPDGAMIIKEQFEAPAARYEGLSDAELWERLSSWTVMVKDSSGAHDGWFWSNPSKNQQVVDNRLYPFDHPISGFGIYCVRCHASTRTNGVVNEYTFASLRNVAGFSGNPLQFEIDESWREEKDLESPPDGNATEDGSASAADTGSSTAKLSTAATVEKVAGTHPRCADATRPMQCSGVLNDEFLKTFPQIGPQGRENIARLPPVTHDWAVRRSPSENRNQPFVTSNQCMSCHAGLVGPLGPTMFVPTETPSDYGSAGLHISPYGEWRWTPMGLAGRDPIFFAQLESELAMLQAEFGGDPKYADALGSQVIDTCMSCHGVMGKRQHDIDHGGSPRHFSLAHVNNTSREPHEAGHASHVYGALARDGISCTVCHHIQPREQPVDDARPYLQYFLETSITGNFHLGKSDEMHGPWQDKEIAPYAMEHALGFKPVHNPYLKSSQMCGTCHVVNLPIVDAPLGEAAPDELVASERNPFFRKFRHHVEQATYLEWLNSEFENEFDTDNPRAKSCQDCHMANDYRNQELGINLAALPTRIAAIQDETYPEAENLPDLRELTVRVRQEGYTRHNFRGLNLFLVEMFNQFDDVLGVNKFDFMTGSTKDLEHAKADFVRQAKDDVASVSLSARLREARRLTANVSVKNKAGHRFPSGVGFRRAILELSVWENGANPNDEPRLLWASGRTNRVGVIVDMDDRPLASESFAVDKLSEKQTYQRHHAVITSPQQAQIYETLLWNSKQQFTTSFLHGGVVVKDNRLLPRGWRKEGPDPALSGPFLEATWPKGDAVDDPSYADGSGGDEVLYEIELPPNVDPQRLRIRAALSYQAIPPYFLQQIFDNSPNGPATKRLHFLCSNIDLAGTPIEGWKLPIASVETGLE